MADPMSIQSGHVFVQVEGDQDNFTITYRDRFTKKVEYTFTNRSALYLMLKRQMKELITTSLHDNELIQDWIKVCKEQLHHQVGY